MSVMGCSAQPACTSVGLGRACSTCHASPAARSAPVGAVAAHAQAAGWPSPLAWWRRRVACWRWWRLAATPMCRSLRPGTSSSCASVGRARSLCQHARRACWQAHQQQPYTSTKGGHVVHRVPRSSPCSVICCYQWCVGIQASPAQAQTLDQSQKGRARGETSEGAGHARMCAGMQHCG